MEKQISDVNLEVERMTETIAQVNEKVDKLDKDVDEIKKKGNTATLDVSKIIEVNVIEMLDKRIDSKVHTQVVDMKKNLEEIELERRRQNVILFGVEECKRGETDTDFKSFDVELLKVE